MQNSNQLNRRSFLMRLGAAGMGACALGGCATLAPSNGPARQPGNKLSIIFCADGTWNDPTEDDNSEHAVAPTNVFKLFANLAGTSVPGSLSTADEQEKVLMVDGVRQQCAKYLHGVGDSNNLLIRLMGGGFGAGVIKRVVNGYVFISRNYEAGANIVIVGFSRGAYTARALGDLIVSQGLLAPAITQDEDLAYRRGAEAWYRFRKAALSRKTDILAHLAEIIADLPAFISQSTLTSADLIPIDQIKAIGVWDTVGAMGIPEYVGKGKRVDAFQFDSTQLSSKVTHGFHAIALDERRDDFTPTLWDSAPNVTQVLFPGSHSDVGGGYPVINNESGLSDTALQWMTNQLSESGVRFSDVQTFPIKPNAAGTAHKPWAQLPWTLPGFMLGPRRFLKGMPEDPSIAARMAAGAVVADPGEQPAPYNPQNLP